MKNSIPAKKRYVLIVAFVVMFSSCKKDPDLSGKLPPGVEDDSGNLVVKGEAVWPDVYSDDRPDYELDRDVAVEGILTIAPGVRIVFHKDPSPIGGSSGIRVNGVLKAKGTSAKPIYFLSDGSDHGMSGIFITSKVDLLNEFSYCVFDAKQLNPKVFPKNQYTRITGLLDFEPWGQPVLVNAKVDHCQFIGGQIGVRVCAGVTLLSFTNNSCRNNTLPEYCALFNIKVMSQIVASNSFTGNSAAAVGFGSFNNLDIQYVDKDITIHKLDVGYYADASVGGGRGGNIVLKGGNLSIEPNTSISYEPGYAIICENGPVKQTGYQTIGLAYSCGN